MIGSQLAAELNVLDDIQLFAAVQAFLDGPSEAPSTTDFPAAQQALESLSETRKAVKFYVHLSYSDQLPYLGFQANETNLVREGGIRMVEISLILTEWIRRHSSKTWKAWQVLL